MIWFWIYLGGVASWFIVYPALVIASDAEASPGLLFGGAAIWPATYLILLGAIIGHAQK